MGGIFSKPKTPSVPSNKKQLQQLERERKQAEARRIEEESALQREEDLRTRRQRGRLGLIGTTETGATKTGTKTTTG